jgi:glycosyltransferase involved in cell wall biosynthesis
MPPRPATVVVTGESPALGGSAAGSPSAVRVAKQPAPRILFVNQSGVYGGAEFGLVDVARHYRDTASVILFADGPVRRDLEAAGVEVEVLALRGLGTVKRESGSPPVAALLDLARLSREVAVRARRYEVIYANSQKAFTVSAVASVMARRPLIWHLRDILNADHFSRMNVKAAVTLANRCASRVLANSEATAAAFVVAGGSPDRVRAVPYGIDAAPFLEVSDADAAAARVALGVGDAPLIGLFGRLAEWKGQHIAIDAAAALPDVHLLLVGGAMFGEDAYAESLRSRAVGLGVADRVHFAGYRDDVPILMRASDIILHTSIAAEPFGRVILEGMLAGRPVIATGAGGAREIVEDGVTGILVPPGDPSALAEAVHRLLAAPDRRRAMGSAARTRAMMHFTPEAMLRSIEQHVNEVVRR